MRTTTRTRRTTTAAVALTAGLVLALTGCGDGKKKDKGSDDHGSGTSAGQDSSSGGGAGIPPRKKHKGSHEVVLEITGSGEGIPAYTIGQNTDDVEMWPGKVTFPWKTTEGANSGEKIRLVGNTMEAKSLACRITVDGKVVSEETTPNHEGCSTTVQ